MKKHVYIRFAAAGLVSALLLTGCAGGSKFCSMGIECYNEAQYENAEQYFKKAVDAEPDNTEYMSYLGLTELEMSDIETARQTFEDILKKDSNSVAGYRGLGIVLYMENEYENAAEQFALAMDKSKSKDSMYVDSLKYYASSLYNLKKYSDSKDAYSKLIELVDSTDKAHALYMRGCCNAYLGDENGAALDFESSIALDNEDYQTYCNMYEVLKENGFETRAESYLKRLVNTDEASDFSSGKTYYILGDYEQAEKCLKSAYNSGESEASFYLAMTYEACGNYLDAEDCYKDYMSGHSSDSKIYNQYAVFLMNREKYDMALTYLQTGLELDDRDARRQLLYNEAVCYEYLSDYSSACECFENYLKEYPNDKSAVKEMEFLKTR